MLNDAQKDNKYVGSDMQNPFGGFVPTSMITVWRAYQSFEGGIGGFALDSHLCVSCIYSPIILTFVLSPVIFCIVVDDPAEVTPTRKPSYSRRGQKVKENQTNVRVIYSQTSIVRHKPFHEQMSD